MYLRICLHVRSHTCVCVCMYVCMHVYATFPYVHVSMFPFPFFDVCFHFLHSYVRILSLWNFGFGDKSLVNFIYSHKFNLVFFLV